MKVSKEIKELLGWDKSEDFTIGEDDFSDLEISPTSIEGFYFFYHKKRRALIKQFVLGRQPEVDRVCQVTLIKKGSSFTPRLAVSVRDKLKKIVVGSDPKPTVIKANVDLGECHENFWKLIRYIETVKDIALPAGKFSLVSQSEAEIVAALKGRNPVSIVAIIKELSTEKGVEFSLSDLNQMLKRREKLDAFKRGLDKNISDESKWQDFFEQNKWIFGYGLKYQILRQEQAQPYYGGTRVDGAGGQKGDYLTSTAGDLSFTVLVEIKTPATPLLRGGKEIRNGAWGLSTELTDAISQIEANIETWNKDGSTQPDNIDALEGKKVFTVKPKGILVIGTLSQLDNRAKRGTFERFRQSIHGVEIITFDELYNRAKYIVDTGD